MYVKQEEEVALVAALKTVLDFVFLFLMFFQCIYLLLLVEINLQLKYFDSTGVN